MSEAGSVALTAATHASMLSPCCPITRASSVKIARVRSGRGAGPDECVSGSDDSERSGLREAPHRPQAGFEAPRARIDRVVDEWSAARVRGRG
jgi:hypothetical protein